MSKNFYYESPCGVTGTAQHTGSEGHLKLDSLYAQMETAKAELGKPFPQEAELKQKSARLAELNIALNIDDKTPLEAMAEEAPPRNEVAKSARPSVLQKLHSYDKPSRTEPKKSKEEVR